MEDVLRARTSDALRGISAMSPRLRFGAAFVLVGLLLTVAVGGLGGKNGASAIGQRTVPATVAASGEPSQADEVRPPSVDPARTDALAQESAGGENDEHTAAAASARVVWSRTAAMQVRSAYARGDLEEAIVSREDFFGVVVLAVWLFALGRRAQVGVEAVQIFTVE